MATETRTSRGQPPALPPPASRGVGPRRYCRHKLQTGHHPWSQTFCPPLPSQAGSAAYVQSWLKEKQLSAASTPPAGPSAASASIGGLGPGKLRLRAGDGHLSSPLAPALRAGSPAHLRPGPAPSRFAPPRPPVPPNSATEGAGS